MLDDVHARNGREAAVVEFQPADVRGGYCQVVQRDLGRAKVEVANREECRDYAAEK